MGRQPPGLICALYNWSRPRDLSHYERFRTYHSMMYRHVEASSVTPYSSRARDKALHAVFIGLIRLLDRTMGNNDGAQHFDANSPVVRKVVDYLLNRVGQGDADEMEDARMQLQAIIDGWVERVARHRQDLKYAAPGMVSANSPRTWLLQSAEEGVASDYPRYLEFAAGRGEDLGVVLQEFLTQGLDWREAMSQQRLRPSQIITTFGPGSIVDLPDDSVMIAGIEHWFEVYKPHKKISEPRLQAALRVVEFRTPPVGAYSGKDIPFVRFPRWRVCPKCSRLSNDFRFPKKGDLELPPVPRCDRCNCETYPARLVVACAKGHIDDFPWYRWLHRGQNCGGGNLFLRGEGKSAVLGDLRIECSCGIEPRTLSGALSRDAMSECGVRCRRHRPWLNDEEDPDDCTTSRTRLYVLQRGASNVYFSAVGQCPFHSAVVRPAPGRGGLLVGTVRGKTSSRSLVGGDPGTFS